MDQFVNELRSEGEHDSQGVFTMAVDKASWKLAAFRLADPQSYPLHVLASAVAGKASRLTITRSEDSIVFSFDGQAYSSQDLEMLRLPALGDGVEARLRELAIAISASSALGRVCFSSVERDAGPLIEVKGDGLTMSVTDEPLGQRLEVFHPLSDLAVEVIKARGRFAPLALTVDGTSLRKPVDFGILEPKVYHGFYLRQGPTDLVVRPHTLSRGQFFAYSGEAPPGMPTLHLALLTRERAKAAGFSLLSYGVAHRLASEEIFGMPYLCGVVCANHLKKDISQQGYVDNTAYEQLLAYVKSSGLDFVERFCASPPPLPPRMLGDFRYTLTKLPSSPAIAGFLKATTSSAPITDRESLLAIGQRAAAGDPRDYQQARATLRGELSRVRQNGKGRYGPNELLASEAALHQAAGVHDPSLTQLRAVWGGLGELPGPAGKSSELGSEGRPSLLVRKAPAQRPDWLLWADGILAQPDAAPATRFRAELIVLGAKPRDIVKAWLEQTSKIPEWTALPRYLGLREMGRLDLLPTLDLGRLALPLQALALSDLGRMSESLQAFRDLAASRGARWLEVGAAVTRGKVGFADWVMVRSRLSMASVSDKRWSVWAPYRDWRGLLAPDSVKEISARRWQRSVFEKNCLPLLLYRMSLAESREAFALMSQVLLQQSLGPAESTLLNLDELPEGGPVWS